MEPQLDTSPRVGAEQSPPGDLAGKRKVMRLLSAGFVTMIVLILTDGVMGVRTLMSIRANVSSLADNQFRNVVLIDEVQRAQSALSSVLYRLSVNPGARDRKQLVVNVDSIEQSLKDLFSRIPRDDQDLALWHEVEQASSAVTLEADRILALPLGARPDLTALLEDRERLITATAVLIRASHARAELTKQQIDQIAYDQLIDDVVLLGASLLIAFFCAWLVLRTATRLYLQITEQAGELTRVSWQLLEKQESLARRLSHELHDELGQSLTALKTNFSRHSPSACVDPSWMKDCNHLLKDSIQSAHEISQLLRPTLLDDFGLDSALAWLCERFEERNGIVVEYQSNFRERLEPQAETHIFRIAQEALTNVARHSGATSVKMSLTGSADTVHLEIADNGVGLTAPVPSSRTRFGVTGMRARARSLQGEMSVRSAPGLGTAIEVTFPLREIRYDETNSHLVS